MIVGTIVASSVGRVIYQISLTVTGGDNGFVTMFWNLVPALTALMSLILSRWIADEHFVIDPTFFLGSVVIARGAAAVFAEVLATARPAELKSQRSKWCCKRGLNSRPLPYQGSALPLSYCSIRGSRPKRASGFLPQQAGQGKAAESGSAVPRPAPRAEVQCGPID